MLYRSILVAGFVGGSHALRIRKEEPQEKLTTALVETSDTINESQLINLTGLEEDKFKDVADRDG